MIHASNAALIEEVDATALAPGELAFWWLGQHSFIVKLANRILYLDPFLTDIPERRIRPLVEPALVQNADLIFGSHDHADHIDRPAWPILAEASPQAAFVVPELLKRKVASELGIEATRLLGLDDGKSIEHRGIRISAVASAHEFLDRDPATGMYPYLGFLIEADGLCIYHSGDTCRYEGLVGKLLERPIDVAFLPINGRDAHRFRSNIVGNLTYQEAADLAGEFAPRLVVPAHYDMFDGNLADPEAFRAYVEVKHPNQRTMICEHGQRIIIGRGG
jgi:L-ascorbate 6-phosphate lactonase